MVDEPLWLSVDCTVPLVPLETVVVEELSEDEVEVVPDDVVVVVVVVPDGVVVVVSDGVVVVAAGSSLVEKNVYVTSLDGGVCAGVAGCVLGEGVDASAVVGRVPSDPVSSSTTGVEANGSGGVFAAGGAGATWLCLSATTGTLRVVWTT